MDLAVIFAVVEHAAEEAEKSEVPFFICGSLFAVFAVLISVYGFKRPDFPETAAAARTVMSTGVVLMLMAVGSAVYVAL
jgi:multisubunit Na+/H+ antiporter MnhG subunit